MRPNSSRTAPTYTAGWPPRSNNRTRNFLMRTRRSSPSTWRLRAICMPRSTRTCAPDMVEQPRCRGGSGQLGSCPPGRRRTARRRPGPHRNGASLHGASSARLAWRDADDAGVRFEELTELCTLAGDKTSLALAMMGPLADAHFHGETRESARLASEQFSLLDSIGDPGLTAGAGFGAVGVKAQIGEMQEVLRWAQATIDWADGDVSKGNLVVGSPLAVAYAMRGLTRWWYGRQGWREDGESAFTLADESADPVDHRPRLFLESRAWVAIRCI